MTDDTRPFPIQGGFNIPKSSVPWWLAEIAYRHYVRLYGRAQSLERLAERGGFGRYELISLIRCYTHEEAISRKDETL